MHDRHASDEELFACIDVMRPRTRLLIAVLAAAGGCMQDGGPQAYTVSLAPVALTIAQGASGNATVTITRSNFTNALTLTLGNVPVGVTWSFDPAAPVGTSSTLTMNVANAVIPGLYNLTLDGTGTAGEHSTASLLLTVSAAPPDYRLSVTPTALSIVQGTNGGATVTITRTNFAGAVTLRVEDIPSGVTASFDPPSSTETSAALTLSVGAVVAPGAYNLNVAGTSSAGDRVASLALAVTSLGSVPQWMPAPVYGMSAVTRISAGVDGAHSCALVSGGVAWCWGANSDGQLGDGTTSNRAVAVAVSGDLSYDAIRPGSNHTCGISATGAAHCWGGNSHGQLGNGTTTNSSIPMLVSGDLVFSALVAGAGATCGLTTVAVYCWGDNTYGQLGDGSTTSSSTPVVVSGNLTFTTIATSGYHTCGLTAAGAVYCWGYGSDGQLGNGTTMHSSAPVAVSGGLTFSAIVTGNSHTCGLTADGAAHCWGDNYFGQIGRNDRLTSTTPVAVSGGRTFIALTLGDWHSCGLTSSGVAYCWGNNFDGQLGNESMGSNFYIPHVVYGGHTFTTLALGGEHTCGLNSSGTIYCWGWNDFGQLGRGTFGSTAISAAMKARGGSARVPDPSP